MPPAPAPSEPELTVEVELDRPETLPVGPVAPAFALEDRPTDPIRVTAHAEVAAREPREARQARVTEELDERPAPTASSTPSASTASPASTAERGRDDLVVPRGPVDLGLARAGARPLPLVLAPSDSPRDAHGAHGAMIGALDAHDTELGTGPGGVVVRVTHDAIHASLAPSRGEATFEATTDERGIAVSVRLLDADAEERAWEDLARVVLRELAKNPLRVHPGARGTRVVFRVRSRVRFPSGTPEKGSSIVMQGLGFGGAFDVTDLGAHPVRQVDVVVVSETRI